MLNFAFLGIPQAWILGLQLASGIYKPLDDRTVQL